MKQTLLMIGLVLLSLGAIAQHNHDAEHAKMEDGKAMKPMFKDKDLGMAYHHYSMLKEALVASNAAKAQQAARQLETMLAKVEGASSAKSEASKVAALDDLEGQRKAFSPLSDEMAKLVNGGKLSMGKIYVEYCPMAKASWLSSSSVIENPYYGDKMLSCGSVKETIN